MTERKTGAAGRGADSGAGAEAASGGWDKVFARHGERMEAAMKAFCDWDGAADAGRKTMSAWLDGGRIAAEGWTGIAGRMAGRAAAAAAAAAAAGEGVAASGKAFACKDPVELMDLQTREARRAAEAGMAEGGALAGMAAKTAERAGKAAAAWAKPAA